MGLRIDLHAKITSFDGSAVKGPEGEALTVGDVVKIALVGMQAQSVEEKVEVYALGMKLFSDFGGGPIEPEEAILIKKAVNAAWPSPVIYGRVVEAIQ